MNLGVITFLYRVDAKPNPNVTSVIKRLDIECMQGACSCTGIHFCFDCIYSELWQCQPFSPSHLYGLCHGHTNFTKVAVSPAFSGFASGIKTRIRSHCCHSAGNINSVSRVRCVLKA